MKKLIPLLLLFLLASCYVHTEGSVRCYNHHICVGDHYTYLTEEVVIIAVTNTQIQIKRPNQKVIWVRGGDFENNIKVIRAKHKQVHVYKNKKEYDDDKEGTQGRKNKGKHKGNPHY